MIKRSVWGVIVIFIFSAGNISGQKVFRNGYIVKKSGETLNGLVEYSVNQGIPSSATFKRFDIAHEFKYSADDILAYGYRNGNRYESKVYNSKVSFFEALVSGRICLYKKSNGFFIEKDHSGLIRLDELPVIYNSGEQKKEFSTTSEFIYFITEGKIILPDKIDKMTDLIPVIAEFNRKEGEGATEYNRTFSSVEVGKLANNSGEHRNSLGLVAGADVYLLKMTSDDYVPAPAIEICPAFGISFERILSRRNDRFSLVIDLLGYRQTFYAYSETNDFRGTVRNDAFYDFIALKLPLSLRYSFSGHRFVPFINTGLVYQYFVDKNFMRIEEVERPDQTVITNEYRDFTFKPKEISIMAALGVRTSIYRGISVNLQARIEYGSGLLEKAVTFYDSFIDQHSIQSSLLLGITF